MYAGIGGYGDIPGGKNVPGLGYYYWRQPRNFRSFYTGPVFYHGVNGLGAALEPGPTPTIKRGSKEPVSDTSGPIHRWQRVIGAKDDGDFGPTTEKMTKDWQSGHAVVGAVPGVVGPETWAAAAVASAPAGTPVSTGPVSGGTAGQQIKISPAILAMLAKPGGAKAASTAAGGGWWSRQSTTTKVAIGAGGVVVLGGLAFMLLGGKKRSATPNPGRRRRRRQSPWCQAATRACDGPFLVKRGSR